MCLKHEYLIGWEVYVGFPFIWFSPFGMRFQWKKSVKDLTHDLQQIEADPSCSLSPVALGPETCPEFFVLAGGMTDEP